MTLTIPTRLGGLRADRDIPQCRIAQQVGVSGATVCRWDAGKRSPQIRSAAIYARLVDHRLVAQRDGRVVADVLDVLLDFTGFRLAAGLTLAEVAGRLHLTVNAVRALEPYLGPRSFLDTVQRYLRACDHDLALIHAEGVVQGAARRQHQAAQGSGV